MSKIIDRFFTVKSVLTLSFAWTYCYIILTGREVDAAFLSLLTAIVGFYFGTQKEKKDQQDARNEEVGEYDQFKGS